MTAKDAIREREEAKRPKPGKKRLPEPVPEPVPPVPVE